LIKLAYQKRHDLHSTAKGAANAFPENQELTTQGKLQQLDEIDPDALKQKGIHHVDMLQDVLTARGSSYCLGNQVW
jgi:hypothetical protein